MFQVAIFCLQENKRNIVKYNTMYIVTIYICIRQY
jgi:hypothetical protein